MADDSAFRLVSWSDHPIHLLLRPSSVSWGTSSSASSDPGMEVVEEQADALSFRQALALLTPSPKPEP